MSSDQKLKQSMTSRGKYFPLEKISLLETGHTLSRFLVRSGVSRRQVGNVPNLNDPVAYRTMGFDHVGADTSRRRVVSRFADDQFRGYRGRNGQGAEKLL